MEDSTSVVSGQAPAAQSSRVRALALAAILVVGCGGAKTHDLDPRSLAMAACSPNTPAKNCTPPFYDDGELTLYQAQLPVSLPIRRPTASDSSKLAGRVGPFNHHPWVTTDDVKVQVTWTLANMDAGDTGRHTVEVRLDPWNEFGRYQPGIEVQGDNAVQDLAGLGEPIDLPGLGTDRSSRVQYTFSFDDLDEVAVDFATAINILANVHPTPAADGQGLDDPRSGLITHAFDRQNRSGSSPLTDPYVPEVIPALVGFNLGIRTEEPANIAIEFAVELIDQNGDRVVEQGSHVATLEAPHRVYSPPGG